MRNVILQYLSSILKSIGFQKNCDLYQIAVLSSIYFNRTDELITSIVHSGEVDSELVSGDASNSDVIVVYVCTCPNGNFIAFAVYDYLDLFANPELLGSMSVSKEIADRLTAQGEKLYSTM